MLVAHLALKYKYSDLIYEITFCVECLAREPLACMDIAALLLNLCALFSTPPYKPLPYCLATISSH